MNEGLTQLSGIVREDSIISNLPEAALLRLSSEGHPHSYFKGQTVFQKGDEGKFFAVVLSGRIKISVFSVNGNETVHNILEAGDVLGEIAALDGFERNADAIAMDASELFIIPGAKLISMMRDDPDVSLALTRALCAKLRSTSEALEATTLDMGRRVASALLRLADQKQDDADDADSAEFRMKIDQTTLAQYAGLTRSNLNRVLKRFERTGATQHEKGILKIYDREWLEDFALSEDL